MSGIVDAHMHIWRKADLPWLSGPMQPRIFGPYEPLRRDYPIEEYLADIRGSGVESAVYVQANWAPERALEEVAFVAGEARRTGFPIAITAFADLALPDARPALEALARHPEVRAIRRQLHWHANPDWRFAPRPDLAADPVLRANTAELARFGFAFELQIFAAQAESALVLVRDCPEVTFVLVHALMREEETAEGVARWKRALAAFAREPNVVVKLSGLGTFVRRLDPALVAEIVREAIALFGPDRCLWGSNFPIEKLWTDYPALLAAHRAALDGLPEPARAAVLRETARRIYRLD
ncbi:MAG: amidohydrolase family protein [Geminicoccaceae bacterium]|nr:amidohydrolase family protein [Geminicoccaceae bacterium]MCS7267693.1 amidohydrolase family protein [Geminicoccaceae bacterium]MDW8123536.1 amidohydrolase family protein [Geminicoccaceae bacterium]MDW8339877.1 amidohydrolase family protein [Geminicoccaceae bacterium]